MTRLAYEKRDRIAKWLFFNFLKDPSSPKGWDDLLHSQKNYWRKLADENLAIVAKKQ